MSITVTDLHAGYGAGPVLTGVTLTVPERGAVAVLGRNGVGKTTLTRVLMGLLRPSEGTCTVLGRPVGERTVEQTARAGLAYMPQEGGVFNSLTVAENLILAGPRTRITRALQTFPALSDRQHQRAGTLSGGERKMLGVARVQVWDAPVWILDEPSEGVWSAVVDDMADLLVDAKRDRAIVLVEQNLPMALSVADYVYVLGAGTVQLEGDPDALRDDPRLTELLTV